MIEKQSLFAPKGLYGEPLFNLIDFSGGHSEYLEKTAGIHPEILAYKNQLEPDPGKTYVHILALGAGEYYGPNLNNDFFNWNGLAHDHTTTPHEHIHGYKTFLNAHAFAHHVNKDPEKAYGDVLLSVLNNKMKRVELIVAIDHQKCMRNGGGKVLERIQAGEYPSTSMGCRVPYDVCSICGNKAKTRPDYCEHMKNEAGKIYPDGRKVFVYNEFPKFFDISFVFIGADRTSFVLEKIASYRGHYVPRQLPEIEKIAGDAGLSKNLRKKSGTTMKQILPRIQKKVQRQSHFTPRPITFGKINTSLKRDREQAFSSVSSLAYSPSSNLVFKHGPAIILKNDDNKVVANMEKASAYKIAETLKHSDIFKDVNSLPMGRAVPMLVGKDPDMPRPIIGRIASSPDIGRSLSEAGSMGIVLKPNEFQRTLLMRAGQSNLADKLEERGHVFNPNTPRPIVRSMRISISPTGGISPGMMDMLGPMLEHRSSITPIAIRRITAVKLPLQNGYDDDDSEFDDSYSESEDDDMPPIVHRIGSMYNGYRSDLLDNIESLMQGSSSGNMLSQIEKIRGGSYLDDDVMQSLCFVPLAYFSHAYWNRCCCDGKTPEEFAFKFVEKNPNIAKYLAEWVANKN
jgi:hypothetical protein